MNFLSSLNSKVYDSAKHPHPFVAEFLALIKYRELLFQFIARSIKTRYKRSVLGVVWTLLNPLLTMLVLTFVFSNLFRFDIPHYPIYLLSGLVAWNCFSGVTNQSMGDMVYNGSLMNRIYVPKALFVASAAGTGLVNLGFAFIPLLIIAIATGAPIDQSLITVLPAVFLLALFAMGVGLIVSTAAVFFADMMPVYEVLLTIWLYATPIIYPISIIPPGSLFLFKLNPMYYLIDLFRLPLFTGHVAPLQTWLIAGGFTVAVLLLGWYLFTSKINEFAYHV